VVIAHLPVSSARPQPSLLIRDIFRETATFNSTLRDVNVGLIHHCHDSQSTTRTAADIEATMASKQERSEIEDIPHEKDIYIGTPSLKSEIQEIDRALEKKVLRKVDLNLVPILFVLFLCAFIDRYE
jgi:hypothetical protein